MAERLPVCLSVCQQNSSSRKAEQLKQNIRIAEQVQQDSKIAEQLQQIIKIAQWQKSWTAQSEKTE